MKAARKVEAITVQEKWQFPIDVNQYNRTSYLTNSEKKEIKIVLSMTTNWFDKSYKILERLLTPINDALNIAGTSKNVRTKVRKIILYEMNERQTSFWAWSKNDWYEILRPTHKEFKQYYKVEDDCRPKLTLFIYLLFHFNAYRIHKKFYSALFANRLFGEELVSAAIKTAKKAYLSLGYGEARIKNRFDSIICNVLIANRSPYLEDLTKEFLEELRQDTRFPKYFASDMVWLSHVLCSLEIISSSLKRVKRDNRVPKAITGVNPKWASWCQRWYDTSTYASKTKKSTYYALLKAGRWLNQEHSIIISPEQWSRDLAIKFVAAVDQMLVGDYVASTMALDKKIGKPLSPKDKYSFISSVRRFFRDCQEWEWIPRKFSPERAFAVPRSIRDLLKPNPRAIADDIWAKLLWAGLNLENQDLKINSINNTSWYPLEMIQAIVLVWLFSGLRNDEIRRLQVGCIRWQKDDIIIPGTNDIVPKDAVCYLEIPANKTSNFYTKPVDRALGEAIEKWENIRPKQPPSIDRKDGSIVDYLFLYRNRKLGSNYINKTVIPLLCKKAGVFTKDTTGNITSHRARSTIATQLATAKEPMTLFELKEWLGHKNVSSTINYTKLSPTKLAKSYQDAEYFKRNLRTVEVLIDQDAITTGAATNGEPWKYYDLGHGLCTYDFFSQCKHRMACAGCGFYIPKGSSKAQIIEAKGNLERMLQEIPLTEDEQFAVEEGIEALTKLKAKLADVPTPSGQTPRQLEEERKND
jgi:integrase